MESIVYTCTIRNRTVQKKLLIFLSMNMELAAAHIFSPMEPEETNGMTEKGSPLAKATAL
jgi:hypothetical protein